MTQRASEHARILQELERYASSQPARAGGPLARAIQYISRMDPSAEDEAGSNAVSELLTKQTLHVLQEEREHELATDETQSDHEYIEYIRLIQGGRYKHIARMIALVARYAGEVPHELIHPTTRQIIRDGVDTSDSRQARLSKVEDLCARYQWTWEDFVDPGLAGNARIACYDIGQQLPRLRAITLYHVMNTMKAPANSESEHMFTDYYCAVVAARWRANSVLAAQPYKTKNEQAAVVVALHESSRRLCDYALQGQQVVYSPRYHPRTLAELRDSARGGHAGAFAD